MRRAACHLLVPGLMLASMTLAAALPWGLSEALRVIGTGRGLADTLGHLGPQEVTRRLAVALAGGIRPLQPLLPYLVVHFWAERRHRAMPDWMVFLAGLTTDVLGQGPLGLWALLFLTGYAMVRVSVSGPGLPSRRGSIALFASTIAVLTGLQWLVVSIYYLRIAAVAPLLAAAALATAIHAVVVTLFPPQHEEARRLNDRLERGA